MNENNRYAVRAKMYLLHGKHLNSLIHDFFPTFINAPIYQAEKYFYKPVKIGECIEMRIHKKTGRVSLSKYETKTKLI